MGLIANSFNEIAARHVYKVYEKTTVNKFEIALNIAKWP